MTGYILFKILCKDRALLAELVPFSLPRFSRSGTYRPGKTKVLAGRIKDLLPSAGFARTLNLAL